MVLPSVHYPTPTLSTCAVSTCAALLDTPSSEHAILLRRDARFSIPHQAVINRPRWIEMLHFKDVILQPISCQLVFQLRIIGLLPIILIRCCRHIVIYYTTLTLCSTASA
jgi:hypothetical protein